MHDAEPSDSPTSLALRSIFFKMLLKLKFTSPARRMSTATSQTITNAKLGERKFLDTTHGRIYYHERGPASGEALVFVHGFFTNSTLWADVVESLSAKYRCISPDLPFGAHQDPMHPDADLTPKGMANILRDIIRDPRLGLTTPPAVVGNDTGGAIIQIALADDHTLASRVVLTPCDCFENFPPKDFAFLPYAAALPGFGTLFANIASSFKLFKSNLVFGLLAKKSYTTEQHQNFSRYAYESKGIRVDIAKAARHVKPSYTLEAAEKLKDFKAPVLLAWAREDRLFGPSYAERLGKVLPNSTIVYIDDSWTFIPQDQPQELCRVMEKWLSENPLPTM